MGSSCAHLRDDYEPGVNRNVPKSLLQRHFHIGRRAVREPQCQQPQDVLQVGPPRRLTCSTKCSSPSTPQPVTPVKCNKHPKTSSKKSISILLPAESDHHSGDT